MGGVSSLDHLPRSNDQFVSRQQTETHQSSGILPIDQVVLESLDKDEAFGHEIQDWVLPHIQVDGWGLPGHGVSKDSCGSFFMKGCLNVSAHPDGLAVFKPMVHKCHSPTCPICSRSWMIREAKRIDYRFAVASKKFSHFGNPIHLVLSPALSYWSLNVDKLRKLAYAVSKQIGLLGGCCIFHPFRDTDDHRWYFSPHFHIIGFGWIDGSVVAEVSSNSGWVCKNVGVRKSVFGTAYYQLSHCGVNYSNKKKHSVTWFGAMAYNKLKVGRAPLDQVFCPYCGEPLETIIYCGPGDAPLPCSGIDGFYLAKSDGWISRKVAFLLAYAPDWFNDDKSLYREDPIDVSLDVF
jgi:hypothetical protein